MKNIILALTLIFAVTWATAFTVESVEAAATVKCTKKAYTIDPKDLVTGSDVIAPGNSIAIVRNVGKEPIAIGPGGGKNHPIAPGETFGAFAGDGEQIEVNAPTNYKHVEVKVLCKP